MVGDRKQPGQACRMRLATAARETDRVLDRTNTHGVSPRCLSRCLCGSSYTCGSPARVLREPAHLKRHPDKQASARRTRSAAPARRAGEATASMTAADSDAGSDIDDCPISLEPYAERGPHQPLFLPECGHTFSRVAIERLLERLRDTEKPGARAVLECPLCNTAQPCVHDVGSCKPNWNLIERITTSRATRARQRRQQQAATPPAPAPPPPSPPPQICWPHDASARPLRLVPCMLCHHSRLCC